MKDEVFTPKIKIEFLTPPATPQISILYEKLMVENLEQVLRRLADRPIASILENNAPLFCHSEIKEAPCNLSFYLIIPHRANAFKFFFDMLTNWLIPGHKLHTTLFYAVDFRMEELPGKRFTFVEVMIRIDSQYELEEIEKNLPNISQEIFLGVSSAYFARRIQETRGLASDQKTVFIQETIAQLVRRLPHYFTSAVFSEMQHFLVMCRDPFKQARESRHLSKIITCSYLFRKRLLEGIRREPGRRQIFVKLINAKMKSFGKSKRILGVLVSLNFLSDSEVLDEKHLLRAIYHRLPGVKVVPESYFVLQRSGERVHTLYLEIEKPSGEKFSRDEIGRLSENLPFDLKEHVEHLMPHLFMPRNEEEIMRNILLLSHQIRYLKDAPQVCINFDEQTVSHLYFTIIHVRAVKEGEPSLEDLFEKGHSFEDVLYDFTKTIGHLRKKYPKQASVFRVKLAKEKFLRSDHSIDLYKARQVVVKELEEAIGSFRDFNGGMITKQNEVLSRLRQLVEEEGVYHELLLENFFYNLTPAAHRSLFEAETLKSLFLLLLDALENESKELLFERDLKRLLIIVPLHSSDERELLLQQLVKLNLSPNELGSSFVQVGGRCYMPLLYRTEDPYKQEHFSLVVKEWMNQPNTNPIK